MLIMLLMMIKQNTFERRLYYIDIYFVKYRKSDKI